MAHDPQLGPNPALPNPGPQKQAWEVARALRWSIARGFLLDPILWLGTLAVGWALGRMTSLPLWLLAGSMLAVATYLADSLLFRSRDTELLRSQPLGADGLLRVRQAELGWILQPLRAVLLLVLAARCGWGIAGGAWFLTHFLPGPLVRIAIFLRLRGRSISALVTLRPRDFEDLSSAAVAASPRERGRLWRVLQHLLPLPRRLRSRVIRDLILLLRGQEARGAFLLLLSPLSFLLLRDELAVLKRPELLTWRTLTCAALGAAAVAYAVGPGIHLLRNRVLVWERLNPNPGRHALRAALIYGLGFALLHSAGTLLTVQFAAGGRFASHVPGLIAPVLILELAMAHFVVLFTMGASSGRKVHGEGTLVLALPIVAVGVAIAAWFSPALAVLYFVVTGGMAAQASARYEQVEVSW
jgi:hypothetical protein